jgi:hypothetical protein
VCVCVCVCVCVSARAHMCYYWFCCLWSMFYFYLRDTPVKIAVFATDNISSMFGDRL